MNDNDTINRGDVKDTLEKAYYGEATLGELLEEIDAIPAVDTKPVVRGEWERHWNITFGWVWKCSSCGQENFSTYKFCPTCGAEMDVNDGE